jgi:hypothetical protein
MCTNTHITQNIETEGYSFRGDALKEIELVTAGSTAGGRMKYP